MKKLFLTLLIAFIVTGCVFAANDYYEKGDTIFTFKAGITLPDFMAFPNNPDFDTLFGGKDMHASLGGHAGISYQSFISTKVAVGAELSYNFLYSKAKVDSKSRLIFTTIPASAKLSYVPVQAGDYDIFLNANAGLSLIKYNGQKYLSPAFASISVNPVYYIGSSWGIGLEAGIYANAEIYTGSKKNDTCFGAFSPIVLTITYRH